MSTIMIAVEHAPLRALLASVLAGAGYDVVEACNASEALHEGERHKTSIDLLCVNGDIDRAGGSVLANNLRRSHPRMKVLLVVTENPRYLVLRTPDAGEYEASCSVLRKPFTIEQLLQTVEQALKPVPVPG